MAANLHLGHDPKSWNKNMLPFIYGERGGIHIINLEHTIVQLRRALNVIREVAFRGGNIVFLGSKPSLHKITVAAAERAKGYFVTKWIGGTITNRDRTISQQNARQPKVHIPDLLVVLDMPNNLTAIREANQMNIPVIAICDTDCNPRLVSYPIAANDDSTVGVELISGVLSLAAREGWGAAEKYSRYARPSSSSH
ncbi:ribosomal protein S2, flavodoxin-like domain-containing protein [Chytridium lagenaria]|nr:ribosomal protein S2, flavodoxin-like domain-containing protein [Chytridium lagenaria]